MATVDAPSSPQDGRKPAWYYRESRADLIAALPRPLGRVLDVGCASGAVGRLARQAGAIRVVGVEIDEVAAAEARGDYDDVLVGGVEDRLEDLHGEFERILCYDVLEHLVDPWAVLRRLRAVAAPGAILHASVPNARHPALAGGIALRGTFGYEQAGLRDVTHLRWFTRRDLADAVRGAGWEVLSESHNEISRARRVIVRLLGGWTAEFMVGQLHVLARNPADAPLSPNREELER